MKNLKRAFLSILLCLPLMAFADHEGVLFLFFYQAISFIVFIIVLVFIRLTASGKGILLLIYLAIVIFSFGVTTGIPYEPNEGEINFFILFLPAVSVVISFLLLRKKFGKIRDNK
jgi:hypothetical protein